jgi:hypothetical protein
MGLKSYLIERKNWKKVVFAFRGVQSVAHNSRVSCNFQPEATRETSVNFDRFCGAR